MLSELLTNITVAKVSTTRSTENLALTLNYRTDIIELFDDS